jgi:hypothetical protein
MRRAVLPGILTRNKRTKSITYTYNLKFHRIIDTNIPTTVIYHLLKMGRKEARCVKVSD